MRMLKDIQKAVFGLMSAAMLTCVCVLLSACIDEKIVEQPTGVVSSQLAVSMPQKVAGTRQGSDIVQFEQDIPSFRGIDDIVIIPFSVSRTIASDDNPVGLPPALKSILKPSQQLVSNTIPAHTIVANNYSVLFENVEIPVLTSSMLFYGKAIESDIVLSDLPDGVSISDLSDADKADLKSHKNGKLSPIGYPDDLSATPSSINFNLQSIVGNTVSPKAQAIVDYLNSIVAAFIDDGIISNTNVDDFLDNKAGSSANVRSLARDLYLEGLASVTAPLTQAAILAGFQDIDNDGDVDGDDISSPSAALIASLDNYPADIHLPDGAAAVEYVTFDEGEPAVSVTKFRTVTGGVSFAGLQVAPPSVYVYPTSLYYRANSLVQTARESKKDSYVPSNSWDVILDEYSGSSVGHSTSSTVMTTPVNYAVGRLDVSVRTGARSDISTLPDNSSIPVALNPNGFPVTGILIDNQRTVDFEFNAKLSATPLTVYDNIIDGKYRGESYRAPIGTYPSTPLHTLVLQTTSTQDIQDLTATPDHIVHVALEFQNNTGALFVGHDNQIIPPGCRFYLIGELDPTVLDGYSPTSDLHSRVFTQDYVTAVNFTITSLKDAYNVIPDMRVPNLDLGLTIDTDWQVGYLFTDSPAEFHK